MMHPYELTDRTSKFCGLKMRTKHRGIAASSSEYAWHDLSHVFV